MQRCWSWIFEIDIAHSARKLVGKEYLLAVLEDPERLGNVRCPRDAGKVALDFRIAGKPVFQVLLLLRQGIWFVRDWAILHYTHAGSHRPPPPQPPPTPPPPQPTPPRPTRH